MSNYKNIPGFMVLAFLLMVAYMLGFCGCAGIPPGVPNSNNCGMILRGQPDGGPASLAEEDLAQRLDAALAAAEKVTDPRLFDRMDNCQALVGFRVYVMPMSSWPDPWGRTWNNGMAWTVAGLTSCPSRTITIGTPDFGGWQRSSLVHEMFHAMQNCEGAPPMSGEDSDEAHAGWTRFGIYEAIEESYAYPKTE